MTRSRSAPSSGSLGGRTCALLEDDTAVCWGGVDHMPGARWPCRPRRVRDAEGRPLGALAQVEGDAAMTAALDRGWRAAQGLKQVRTLTRDLFRNPLLPDEFRKIDPVVIDPPRAGAEAQVRQIAESKVPVLGFVSCNPVTFARDAAVLRAGGYLLDWVQVVDQFRWSSHIELAARFSRAHI